MNARAGPAGYRLFGSAGSGSAAIEAALLLCEQPFELIEAASWDKNSALDALAEANPLLQIPTLVLPDGAVLTESAAILMHLGLSHPAAALLPVAAGARGQHLRGLVYIAANCYAAIGIIDYPQRWCDDTSDAVSEDIRRGTRARLHHCWDVFADTCAPPGAFYGGDAPGALDLLATVVSKWGGARAHLKRRRPALFALTERVEAHPAVAAVFERHWPR